MAYSFRGGIHPGTHADPGYKSATNTKPIEKLALPDEVILPVSMHIGAPAKPIVSVGDTVDLGQPIAEAGGFVSAPVHATVSGKVKAIEPRLHPNGSKVLSIVIENDGEDRKHESVHPYDFASMSNEERIECIRSAGIVGHGGATFPTHVKIQSGIGKCDTVIINAAECEPYITSDHRLLLERPEETIGGLKMLAHIMGVQTAIIAIEENKKDTFAKIEELIADDPRLKLYPLTCKYPQGAEKQLINACTGREVPSGKLPADAGCAVFNVDTAGAVYRRFTTGMPVIRRIVTISGSAVAEPKNLEARIGTPIEKLIDAANRVEDGNFEEHVEYEGEEEFEKLCHSFNTMQDSLAAGVDRAEEYDKAKTEMIAGMSHDLRTPLTSIKGYIKGVKDGVANTPQKQEQYLDIAYQKACAMDVLLRKLSDFSKLETGNMPMEPVTTDFGAFLQEMLDDNEQYLREKDVNVIFFVPEEKVITCIDHEQTKRVLRNIMENSMKYRCREQVLIRMNLIPNKESVILKITDDGEGVPEEKLPHLFEQFYRGDETRNSRIDGDGLGLYIAKRIIEQQGGSISASNHGGFCITIILPRVGEEQEQI